MLVGQRDVPSAIPPGGPQPRGRIQTRSVEIGKRRLACLCHTPQNRIDQTGERREPARPRQGDRSRHRRMARRVQQQQTRCSQPQHMAYRVWRRLAQQRLEDSVQRSHSAQHSGRQAMCRGTIPWCDRGQRIQRLLQRSPAFEDSGEKVERGLARGISHQRAAE